MPKLYLSNNSAGYVPTTVRGGWEQSAGHVARGMHTAQDPAVAGGPSLIALSESSASANFDVLLIRAVSAPLATNWTFAGTLNLMMAVAESLNDADFAYYLHVYVTQGNSDTPRGNLLTNYADPMANEWIQTTPVGKALNAAQALTSVAALAGDRIVAEIGYRAYNTITGSRIGTLYYGGSGSDLVAGGSALSGIGYLDFSDAFTLTNNPVLRVSQTAVETLYRPTTAVLRVSQTAQEVLRHPVPVLRATQLAAEVLRKNGAPVAAAQGGMLVIAT